jgi:transposase-like protein
MQFKRVLAISDSFVACKKVSYQNHTPASIQKQHVRAFEGSGLKQVEFCKQYNIPYSTFTNWWRRHRCDKITTQLPGARDGSMIIETQEKKTLQETEPTLHMTCDLPNGLSITVSPVMLTDLPHLIEVLSICKLN